MWVGNRINILWSPGIVCLTLGAQWIPWDEGFFHKFFWESRFRKSISNLQLMPTCLLFIVSVSVTVDISQISNYSHVQVLLLFFSSPPLWKHISLVPSEAVAKLHVLLIQGFRKGFIWWDSGLWASKIIDFYHSVNFYNDLSSKLSANTLELLSQNVISLKVEEKGKLW